MSAFLATSEAVCPRLEYSKVVVSMDQESNWNDFHRVQASTLIRLARLTRDPNTAASLMRLAAQHEEMADQADQAESERHASVAFQSVPPIVRLYAGDRRVGRTPVS